MTTNNFKIIQPDTTIGASRARPHFKLCFRYVTERNGFSIKNKDITSKEYGIVLDKMRQICSIPIHEFLRLPREDGIERLERCRFKKNIFKELDNAYRHPDDVRFASIRYSQKGRLIFKECNVSGEGDVLHLLAIDPCHVLY